MSEFSKTDPGSAATAGDALAGLTLPGMLEQMPVGAAYGRILSEHGRPVDFEYLYANPAYHRITGLGEVVGRRISEVIPGVHVTDPWLLATYARVAATGQPESFDHFLGGLQRWLTVNAFCPRPGHFVALFSPFSERRETEARLQEQTARARLLQVVADESLDFIGLADLNGQPTLINPAGRRLLGLDESASLAGRHISQFAAPAERERLASDILPALFAAGFWQGDLHFVHQDGHLIPMSCSARVHFDDKGQPAFLSNVARDISDRLAAERSAQQSEAMLVEAQAVAHIGSWRVRLGEDLFVMSAETARLFDLPESGRATFAEWVSRVHPEDRAGVAEVWKAALKGAAYDHSYRALVRGEEIWIRALGRFEFDASGRCVNALGTVQDITPLKRLENQLLGLNRRLTSIFENAMVCLAIFEGRQISWINDGAFAITGYHPEELLGQPTRVFFASDEEWAEVGKRTFAAHSIGQPFDEELQISRKDGSRRWVQLSMRVANPGEMPMQAVAVFYDVTERRQLQDELIRAKEAAEAANKAKSQFLATMSHELRTPLNGVMGALQMMRIKSGDADYVKESAWTGLKRAEHLLVLINDILDFSVIDAGQVRFDPQPFSLPNLIVDIEGACRGQLQPGVRLSVDADAAPNRLLLGDVTRLRQVLSNLLGNAIKFTASGEVELAVTTVDQDARGVQLNFSVRDTGIGMSDAEQRLLFQPFQQADMSITRRFGDTGLGLVISQRLVTLMGGDIHVSSAPGQGSLFSFSLVLPWGGPALTGDADGADRPDDEVPPQLPGVRLLVVDDDPSSLLVAAELLDSEGAVVACSTSGEDALHIVFDVDAPAAILMDVQMPGMDGLETTRRLRAGGYRGRIIALTANAYETDRQACLNAGMDAFTTKPLLLDEVVPLLLSATESA